MKKPKLVRCENCEKLKKDKRQILQALDAQNRDMRKLRDELDELRKFVKNVSRIDRKGEGNRGSFYAELESESAHTAAFIKRYEQCKGRNLPNKSVDLLIIDKFNYKYCSQVLKGVLYHSAALLRQCLNLAFFPRKVCEFSKKLISINCFPLRNRTQVDSEIFQILGRGNGVYRHKQIAAQ